MKTSIAVAVILVVLAVAAQSYSLPGGKEWKPAQQRQPQPVAQARQPIAQARQPIAAASQESVQRVAPPTGQPILPGGKELKPAQQRQPQPVVQARQPIAAASQESVQRVAPPTAQPISPQVLSALNPILLLVKVDAITPQSATPLRYEATYVARNRGAVHTAPLPGYSRSAASINIAPAPGTSF